MKKQMDGTQEKEEEQPEEEDSLWSEGAFVQTMDSREREAKMKTFHKRHDEDMDFSCKRCKKSISAHNKDWHDGMCDDCFNDKYFPEEKEQERQTTLLDAANDVQEFPPRE